MLTKEQIITKLGIQSVDEKTQQETLQQLADAVRTRIMFKISEKLTDENLDELNAIIDSNKSDDQKGQEVDAYIASHIENYDAWAAQIEEDTINEIANNREAILDEVQAKMHSTTPTD